MGGSECKTYECGEILINGKMQRVVKIYPFQIHPCSSFASSNRISMVPWIDLSAQSIVFIWAFLVIHSMQNNRYKFDGMFRRRGFFGGYKPLLIKSAKYSCKSARTAFVHFNPSHSLIPSWSQQYHYVVHLSFSWKAGGIRWLLCWRKCVYHSISSSS